MHRNSEVIRRHLTAQMVMLSIFASLTVPLSLAATPAQDSLSRAEARRQARLGNVHPAARRERPQSASERRAARVEQRRRTRSVQQGQQRRARDEAAQKRRAIQSRRTRSNDRFTASRRTRRQAEGRNTRREERLKLKEDRSKLEAQRKGYNQLRQAILTSVNRERSKVNLTALTMNKDLELSAQLHAEDMLIRDYFNHFTPEGLSHVDRIKKTGYATIDMENCNCSAFKAAIGENIAKGQRSVNWVMNEWMDSPTHKENILSTHFTELGIGIAEGRGQDASINDRIWVQNFGSIEITPR
tara:strand:+ start:63 stop:962 length:900 start_codon:yes stop_codon:yes gene_type:complete